MSTAVLGTMTWGPSAQVHLPEAIKQLEAFVAAGGTMVDTARIYQAGETEQLIGEILESRPDLASKVQIHTKAHPLIAKLDLEGIQGQLDASLKALRRTSVDIFYIHSPDIRVPLVDTLKALDVLFQQGKFKELGLSNYPAWEVVNAHLICMEHKLKIRPTVYQGVYNAISRGIEPELMPAIRTFKMRCYMFNPLAGGILTGRYTSIDEQVTGGRFSAEFDIVPKTMENHPLKGVGHVAYRKRYWKEAVFEALNIIRVACEAEKISMPEAAVRWVLRHSALSTKNGDAIIFGASSVSQVENNMKAVNNARDNVLNENILKGLNDASNAVLPHEGYFRGYDPEAGRSTEYLAKFQ